MNGQLIVENINLLLINLGWSGWVFFSSPHPGDLAFKPLTYTCFMHVNCNKVSEVQLGTYCFKRVHYLFSTVILCSQNGMRLGDNYIQNRLFFTLFHHYA